MAMKKCPKWILEIREKAVVLIAKQLESKIGLKTGPDVAPTLYAMKETFLFLREVYEKGFYFSREFKLKKRKKGRKFYLSGRPDPSKFGFKSLR